LPKVLFLACSAYSGSTLLSFLLNTHPEIFTVGHMEGWSFGPDEDFRCSCGESIADCPFYAYMGGKYRERGLSFDLRDFDTAYCLVRNDRLNRYLTESLPFVENSGLECFRDRVIGSLRGVARTLRRHDRANLCFIESAMAYAGASVFVDNSQSAYRLRHLRRIESMDISVVHLTRDMRGVALSNMKLRGWSPELATELWLRQQRDAARIGAEREPFKHIYFEEICESTDATLAEIHEYLGLKARPFSNDFKVGEHHILGHKMREGRSTIGKEEKWRNELTAADRRAIELTAANFAKSAAGSPVARIVEYYLNRN
jgi:hypothetical protein